MSIPEHSITLAVGESEGTDVTEAVLTVTKLDVVEAKIVVSATTVKEM